MCQNNNLRIEKISREGTAGSEEVGFKDYGCYKSFHIDRQSQKRVLITGVGSYIGENFRTYASVHFPNLIIDTIDMRDNEWREHDFSLYDTVFHVAGIAHSDTENVNRDIKDKYYAVNTDLAIETAKIAKRSNVKQFIFMSSMIIYGNSVPYNKNKVINEYTIPKPANFYGDSKWKADMGIRELGNDSFHVAVLRPPMIYGKGCKGNYQVLSKWAKKLSIFPNVNNKRSMLHIDNLCEFVSLLILSGESGIYFPQNKEYSNTASLAKEISITSGKHLYILNFLNPIVLFGCYIPGRVGKTVNKAFGNSIYGQKISTYQGLKYQCLNLRESIIVTERQ